MTSILQIETEHLSIGKMACKAVITNDQGEDITSHYDPSRFYWEVIDKTREGSGGYWVIARYQKVKEIIFTGDLIPQSRRVHLKCTIR